MTSSNKSGADRSAINRQNARHSTGPRTPQGKQRSSLNAMRHGLTGQTIVSPHEDLKAYLRFTRALHDDLKPKGAFETQLVQTISDNSWRLNRARAYENNRLTLGYDDHSADIDVDDPEIHRALATAQAHEAQARTISGISMHEERLSRQIDRAFKQLVQVQSERRSLEQEQMAEAARLYQLHNEQQEQAAAARTAAESRQAKRATNHPQTAKAASADAASIPNEPVTPYDPTRDGFVFANAEIVEYIDRRQRSTAARRAEMKRAAAAWNAA